MEGVKKWQSVLGPVAASVWGTTRGFASCPATAALMVLLFAAPCLAQPSPEDVVTAQRAHYGERVAPSDAPTLLQAIAADLTQTFGTRYGLLVKTSGNQCGGFACDIVCDQNGDLFDVFTDGPDATQHYAGQAVPQWIPKGTLDGRTCALVDAPAISGSLDNGGAMSSLDANLTLALQRLDQLEAALLDLNARERADVAMLAQAIEDRAATLNAAIATLDARPIVKACKASVFGVPIHCEVKP